MRPVPFLFLLCGAFAPWTATAQDDLPLLAHDEEYLLGDDEDEDPCLNRYERLNKFTGGDSVRACNGRPCAGWVEDRYPDGTLMHRGYYITGKLSAYRNFHPDGVMERDFRELDAVKSMLRTYHRNGTLRSETRFADGTAFRYRDHYASGRLRYEEERHRKKPYYTRMVLCAADGTPISTLVEVDKRRKEVELKEYHPGGALKSEGRARYNPMRMDSQRIGTWKYYDREGAQVREEDYAGGKVAAVREGDEAHRR